MNVLAAIPCVVVLLLYMAGIGECIKLAWTVHRERMTEVTPIGI